MKKYNNFEILVFYSFFFIFLHIFLTDMTQFSFVTNIVTNIVTNDVSVMKCQSPNVGSRTFSVTKCRRHGQSQLRNVSHGKSAILGKYMMKFFKYI